MSHYFENDTTIKSKRIEINYSINNQNFMFYSDNGVFSKNEYDLGSEILVKSLLGESLNGRILDLGCGYGETDKYLKELGAKITFFSFFDGSFIVICYFFITNFF